jgi:succinyl-CoA synthetase beta subunit
VDAAEGEEGQGQVKKTATEAQIAGWTRALVTLAQASLPRDHPLCSVGPGRYPYETHQKAAYAALKQMAAHGVTPPSEDEIRRLANGGVDIEELAATKPEAIKKIHFLPSQLPAAESILPVIQKEYSNPAIPKQIADIAAKLAKLFVEKDCSIAEINPLALTPGDKVMALDAKIVFDDNAIFRHEDFKAIKDPDEEDDREKKAKELNLSYVSMKGNVGCLVNGAGLAMATMDMIKLAGGEPANFLDVGGGANADQVREAFKIILQDERVETILVNIFGGIMKCDVIADGIIQASKEINLHVPLVVRLEGTRVEEGRALLKNSGLKIISCNNIKDAAQTAVEQAAKHRQSHVHSR